MVHRTPPAILSYHQGNDGTFEPLRQEALTSLTSSDGRQVTTCSGGTRMCPSPRALVKSFFDAPPGDRAAHMTA